MDLSQVFMFAMRSQCQNRCRWFNSDGYPADSKSAGAHDISDGSPVADEMERAPKMPASSDRQYMTFHEIVDQTVPISNENVKNADLLGLCPRKKHRSYANQ
jgi:hypothetical protein